MLTPLERLALSASGLKFSERRKLLRASRELVSLDDEARARFRGPFKVWGTPMRQWMFVRLIVCNPRLILLGIPAAIISWLIIIVQVIYKLN